MSAPEWEGVWTSVGPVLRGLMLEYRPRTDRPALRSRWEQAVLAQIMDRWGLSPEEYQEKYSLGRSQGSGGRMLGVPGCSREIVEAIRPAQRRSTKRAPLLRPSDPELEEKREVFNAAWQGGREFIRTTVKPRKKCWVRNPDLRITSRQAASQKVTKSMMWEAFKKGYIALAPVGANMCNHGRKRHQCPECVGECCPHGRRKERCKECEHQASLCAHGKRKHQCGVCTSQMRCPHGRHKIRCVQCNDERNRRELDALARNGAAGDPAGARTIRGRSKVLRRKRRPVADHDMRAGSPTPPPSTITPQGVRPTTRRRSSRSGGALARRDPVGEEQWLRRGDG